MIQLSITGGYNKLKEKEAIQELRLQSGKVYTIVGKTGSGKTQLIEDIEALSDGDGLTGRTVSVLDKNKPIKIAHLSQNMNFVLDLSVQSFIEKRLKRHRSSPSLNHFLSYANSLCGENISLRDNLTRLSGGQSRALMIADIAFNSKAEIILIDEIENAGIDKIKAMNMLVDQNKLVLVITHDPLLALYGHQRLIMEKGGISKHLYRTDQEKQLIQTLNKHHMVMETMRQDIRRGLTIDFNLKETDFYDHTTFLE